MARRWPEVLWIVRHGQSAGNVARDAADAAGLPMIDIAERDVDVPLSPLGEQQAAALGRWFAAMPAGERPDRRALLAVRARPAHGGAHPRGGRAGAAGHRHRGATSGCARRSSASSTASRRHGIAERFPEQAEFRAAARQVLPPAAGRRELVRRDPAPAQRARHALAAPRAATAC